MDRRTTEYCVDDVWCNADEIIRLFPCAECGTTGWAAVRDGVPTEIVCGKCRASKVVNE